MKLSLGHCVQIMLIVLIDSEGKYRGTAILDPESRVSRFVTAHRFSTLFVLPSVTTSLCYFLVGNFSYPSVLF